MNTHAHTHTSMYTCTHTHTCTHAYTRIHTHARMHTQDGYSAIDIAAYSGHEDVVELLLDLKADPELTDEQILSCIATSKVTAACYCGGSRLYTYVG